MAIQFRFLIVLLWFPVIINAQKGFSVGLNLCPEFSYISVYESNIENDSITYEDGGLGLGVSFGLHVRYDLNEQFFIRSGLNYEHSKYNHKIKGIINNGVESRVENTISVNTLGVPFDFAYKIPAKVKQLQYLIGVGALLNFKLNDSSEVESFTDTGSTIIEGAENEIQESNFSVLLFLGMDIDLNYKVSISLEPHLKYTPHEFVLYSFQSKARTLLEGGLTLRLLLK